MSYLGTVLEVDLFKARATSVGRNFYWETKIKKPFLIEHRKFAKNKGNNWNDCC